MEIIKKINLEKLLYTLFGITFFVGIWHALPLLNIISDEMYFVGGVLRALEHHTILPLVDDVPYGTITYILNYIKTVLMLIVMFPFFSFKIDALKHFLLESPSAMYLSVRFLSSIISIFYLYFIVKILKNEQKDLKIRMFLVTLLFSNIMTTTILHTGKMWVLSIFLVIVSFYYLYQSIASNNETESHILNRNIFLTVLFSFLAIANFPLNFFSLINIPILFYNFKNNPQTIKKTSKYILISGVLSICIMAINFGGIKDQITSVFTGYNPILVEDETLPKMSFLISLTTYLKKLIYLYPLLLLTILVSLKDKIKNKKLFIISLIYFILYFAVIVIVATWPVGFGTFLRYLFPLNFFLFFILVSLNLTWRKIYYPIIAVAIFYFLFTLFLLSSPTTYNNANKWITKNLSKEDVVIMDNVRDFRLTKNKKSQLLTQDLFCGTKCKETIAQDLNNDFIPLVLDDQSLASATTSLKKYKNLYFIENKKVEDLELVASFDNPTKDYYSVDYNLGIYVYPDFLKTKNLGQNIYIYKASN